MYQFNWVQVSDPWRSSRIGTTHNYFQGEEEGENPGIEEGYARPGLI